MKKSIMQAAIMAGILFLAACGTVLKPTTPGVMAELSPVAESAGKPAIKPKTGAEPAGLSFKKTMKEATLDYYSGNFGGSLEKYTRILTENDSEEVMANMATVYRDNGYYSDAINYYEAALQKKNEPFRRMNLGYCRYFTGDLEGARKELENVLEVITLLKKKDPDALKIRTFATFGLGLVYFDKKKNQKAAEYFNKVIEYDIRFSQAHFLLGEYYSGAGEDEKALGAYKNAVGYDNSFYKAYLRMAGIYEKLKQYAQAFDNYKKVSFIEPENRQVAEKVKEYSGKAAEYIKKGEDTKEKTRKETKAPKVNYIKEDKDIPVLKILIVNDAEKVRFKCAGKYNVYYDSRVVKEAEPEEDLKIWREGVNINILGKTGKPVAIRIKRTTSLYFVPELKNASFTIFDVTVDKGSFWANNKDRSYRGVLRVETEDRGFHLINEVNLEEYLYSVVPSEIGAANIEALKAQAVIARSYIYKRIEDNKGSTDFHLCADVHCQAYTGISTELQSTTKAVDLTRGEIISGEKGCLSAFYFATCGGRTCNVEEVWGGAKNPGLIGIGDYEEAKQKACYRDWPLTPENLDRWIKLAPVAYCAEDKVFRWFRIAEPDEVKSLKILRRDLNGYVREVQTGDKKFTLDKTRQALNGLRSSFYKVEKNLVFGCGWGHGVGLCQAGATKMAAVGKSYQEILTHYYYKASLKRVYGKVEEEKTGTAD